MQQKALYSKLEAIRKKIDLYIEQRISYDRVEKCVSEDNTGDVEEYDRISTKEIFFNNAVSFAQCQVDETALKKIEIPESLRREKRNVELDKVLERKEESFSEMLLRMIDEKGLKDSDVYKQANIDRRLFSKIRGDKDYVPSKKTAISFCLALHLRVDEANKLIASAGYTLSSSSRFDLIIMYLLENQEYNIHFANIVLDDYGEGSLSK